MVNYFLNKLNISNFTQILQIFHKFYKYNFYNTIALGSVIQSLITLRLRLTD